MIYSITDVLVVVALGWGLYYLLFKNECKAELLLWKYLFILFGTIFFIIKYWLVLLVLVIGIMVFLSYKLNGFTNACEFVSKYIEETYLKEDKEDTFTQEQNN